MGVRFYDPHLGRFLQVDPIEGGSANDYDYANQDWVNQYDLDGRAPVWWKTLKDAKVLPKAASSWKPKSENPTFVRD